jgi:hypothetical protein
MAEGVAEAMQAGGDIRQYLAITYLGNKKLGPREFKRLGQATQQMNRRGLDCL